MFFVHSLYAGLIFFQVKYFSKITSLHTTAFKAFHHINIIRQYFHFKIIMLNINIFGKFCLYRTFSAYLKVGEPKVHCYCQLKEPPGCLQMQKFCNLKFLEVLKIHFQDTPGESKIKNALLSRTYKVNLKKYTLFNKIIDQDFEIIFQRLCFSIRFIK